MKTIQIKHRSWTREFEATPLSKAQLRKLSKRFDFQLPSADSISNHVYALVKFDMYESGAHRITIFQLQKNAQFSAGVWDSLNSNFGGFRDADGNLIFNDSFESYL